MKTEILAVSHPQTLSRALGILHEGGLVAFPTDTVYGVGALAFEAEAIEQIYTIKDRSKQKAIPILLAYVSELEQVAQQVTPIAQKLAARFWPGPLTLVVAKHPNLPASISASPTVGVRIPDHPTARALLRAAGPMAVTSANRSGEPNASTAEEVLQQLGGRIPLILDGGRTPGGVPSTVVNCLGAEPVLLRSGPISEAALLAAIG
jgi:L-threonylcarbamoyladenylate synthase